VICALEIKDEGLGSSENAYPTCARENRVGPRIACVIGVRRGPACYHFMLGVGYACDAPL